MLVIDWSGARTGEQGERWLAECRPPFWGRRGRPRPSLEAHFRATEEATRAAGAQPKSLFQIGGAGAVGTGSLRGMAVLARLQRAGFSVWPFDPPGWPRVVEIYPRLLAGPVVKSSAEARTEYLAERFPELDDRMRQLAASCEDAFDAAVSAVVMSLSAGEFLQLERTDAATELLEGRIWAPQERG